MALVKSAILKIYRAVFPARAKVFARALWASKFNISLINSPNNIDVFRTISLSEDWVRAEPCLDAELPSVDISVVTFNSSRWIVGFAESLLELDYDFSKIKVIFTDNSSTDDTLLEINSISKKLHEAGCKVVVQTSSNVGFGRGHNSGIALGGAEFVLVTNVDLIFDKAALKTVIRIAKADEERVVAWELGQRPYEHPKFYNPVTGQTSWNSHACVLMRRRAFESVGGYCKNIFMYGEDVELSYRFREKGYVLKYCPQASVVHYTYDDFAKIKPIQHLGSVYANLLIRLRYGSFRDIVSAPFLAVGLLAAPERFPGSHSKLFVEYLKLLSLAPKLVLENFKNRNGVTFPFRGFDYELSRAGADVQLSDKAIDGPLVSIITRTVAERSQLLSQCIRSVAMQSYKNIEHIIVEDRSSTLKEFVEERRSINPNIVYISNDGVGRSAAGNTGMRKAKGDYLIFLDDDDLFFADHIEVLLGALVDQTECKIAVSLPFELPTEMGGDYKIESVNLPSTPDFMRRKISYKDLAERNYFAIQTVLFERSLFERCGGFDEDLDYLEDWLLWKKFISISDYKLVLKTTSIYRTPTKLSIASDRQKKLDHAYREVVARAKHWRTINLQNKTSDKHGYY
jgi:GT2 family glycosyltransferase